MKQINKWIAKDGKEFTDKDECKLHEKQLDLVEDLQETFSPLMHNDAMGRVIKYIAANPTRLRDVLNKHIRRMPKDKKVKQAKQMKLVA